MQAQLPHLYSCLNYLAHFHSSGDWNGAAGFQVTIRKHCNVMGLSMKFI
jgi:hypothetical protein